MMGKLISENEILRSLALPQDDIICEGLSLRERIRISFSEGKPTSFRKKESFGLPQDDTEEITYSTTFVDHDFLTML